MRILILSAAISLPLLAACSTMGGVSSYKKDMDALEAECTRSQGILTTTVLQTGRPQTDYACKITGSATRIPPR
jgi:hypothetical protein